MELRNNLSSQKSNKKQTETKIQSQASKKKEKDPLEKNERIAVSVAETKKPPVKRKRIENYSDDDDYSPNQEEIEPKPKKKPALKNPPKKTQAAKKEHNKASKKIEKFQKKITTFQATLTENNEVAELVLQKRIMHRVICSGFLFTEKEKKKLTSLRSSMRTVIVSLAKPTALTVLTPTSSPATANVFLPLLLVTRPMATSSFQTALARLVMTPAPPAAM